MNTVSMERVTVVVEDTIEPRVVKDIHDLGASGYTYTVVHGDGTKGTRPNQWDGPNAK